MVAKMMRWRPWPPLPAPRKYSVRLQVKKLEGRVGAGNDWVHAAPDKDGGAAAGLTVEIRWKGPKIALSTLRRINAKKDCSKEACVQIKEDEAAAEDGGTAVVVEWDEDFQNICTLTGHKDNVFHPWEVFLAVFSNGVNQGAKSKASLVATVGLNLAEFANKAEEEIDLIIPLPISGSSSESPLFLHISLCFLEFRTSQDSTESAQRTAVPIQSPPQSADTPSLEKDELSAIKAGLRKVKILTEYVSTRRAKKACREEEGSDSRGSAKSDDGDYSYPFDTDSLDDFDERESDDNKEDPAIRKSFSYGTLAHANFAGAYYSKSGIDGDNEDWIYYSNRKSDVGSSRHVEDLVLPAPEPPVVLNTKRSILPWKKRKLSFRSPKAKGEPLLKKDNGDEGGDDIDYDRRQLSSDESLAFWWRKTDEDSSVQRSSVSDFGDDNFAVGTWEQKEIMSRDGLLKLQTQVFFASIDQRSEKASGESACTALVAVIADWLQNNQEHMPVKSQFDMLIREGSLEWRKLCENETFQERFPDKHFDLDTVLGAKIRSLSVLPGKSFIGFFYPDGMEGGGFDFLHGAMSFDNIWEEIDSSEPQVYIVSWNDHFFVLKVTADAFYIIDTLGERLYEGCNQAYILKFDRDTSICKLPETTSQSLPEMPMPLGEQLVVRCIQEQASLELGLTSSSEPIKKDSDEKMIISQGKESCKEYIKNFLAAIPIRELQADIKKGLIKSTTLVHHRLQIEFHFTKLQEAAAAPMAPITPLVEEATAVMPEVLLQVA